MFTQQDLQQLAQRGVTPEQVENQLKQIAQGFPFLRLEAAASVDNGIMAPTDEERAGYVGLWQKYMAEGHKIVKFVPASGAASRMFKNLFEYLDAPYTEPQNNFEKTFFENIKKFAFRKALCAKCKDNCDDTCAGTLISESNGKAVVANLLKPEGLN